MKILPLFVRATAQVKFGASFPSLSAVEFDKYTLLAKKKTFANDPILPTRLMRSAKFMCENDFGRQPRYVNIVKVERKGEDDFDAPPSRAIYIIGEYFKHAKAKCGSPNKATQEQSF